MNRMSEKQVLDLQRDVTALIGKVDRLKHNMQTHDFQQLTNHLQYCMTTLRNIQTMQGVERATMDGYDTQAAMTGARVLYNPDGSTKVVQPSATPCTGQGWERQFDQSTLINPPCYVMPPQGVTDLKKLGKK